MKTQHLPALLIFLIPGSLLGQTLFDSNSFFDPDFKIRQTGVSSGILNLIVDNAPVSGSGTSGNQSWTHSAGGFAQVRTNLFLVANLDAQLAAYTSTINDSLVFGREINTSATFLNGAVDLSSDLEALANQVAGASVIYNWQSTATVSGLAIVPDQLYQVDFHVASGSGLPVDLLDSASFGITSNGISGASNESATLLNLLNIINIGTDPSTGDFSFVFKSNQNRSSLDFSFAASTLTGVTLLGGTEQNQNVLTFSGFQVTAIPEPDGLMLSGVFIGVAALRRKRNS